MDLKTPAQWRRVLRLLTEVNKDLLRQGQYPPLYSSGVRYQKEARMPDGSRKEEWKTVDQVYADGIGDCEDLVGIRAAELELAGTPTTPDVYPTGGGNYHSIVRVGAKIEDPSVILIRKHKEGRHMVGSYKADRLPDGTWTGCVNVPCGNGAIQVMGQAEDFSTLMQKLLAQTQAAITPPKKDAFDIAASMPGVPPQAKAGIAAAKYLIDAWKSGKLKKGWQKFLHVFKKKKVAWWKGMKWSEMTPEQRAKYIEANPDAIKQAAAKKRAERHERIIAELIAQGKTVPDWMRKRWGGKEGKGPTEPLSEERRKKGRKKEGAPTAAPEDALSKLFEQPAQAASSAASLFPFLQQPAQAATSTASLFPFLQQPTAPSAPEPSGNGGLEALLAQLQATA